MEVASRLAAQGVRAVGVAARHSAGEPTPEEVGLTIPVLNSALPRRFLYAAWDRLSMPRVDRMLGVGSGGGTQVVHATTWAIPPTSRPLVVTVHDVAFLRDASHFTSHGAAYFNRALDITKHRADAVIVPSEATARDCIEAGIDEGLITVIPHGLTRHRLPGGGLPRPPWPDPPLHPVGRHSRTPQKPADAAARIPRHGLVHGS